MLLPAVGALPPSGGDIRVMGHSLLSPDGLEVAQGVMGVCPQFDVLWDELTGKEHMYIYGCIKGLPSTEVSRLQPGVPSHTCAMPPAGSSAASCLCRRGMLQPVLTLHNNMSCRWLTRVPACLSRCS